ncbi:lysine exporter LysO family protein [Acinetobacter sp. ANC 4635]|uniref:lysine exporter LysO family protein n=1 Tax=Acinetobacter sp. ANC 4635 TaxID=2529846 RepID=UPI002B05F0DF|nr:lysine exporter LysO family protein [Acinetobacter sp. ANC 4635]
MTAPIKTLAVASIGYLVWGLLIVIGYQFADVLFQPDMGWKVLRESFIYASILSASSFLLLLARPVEQQDNINPKRNFRGLLKPLQECCIAMLMVGLGMLSYLVLPHDLRAAQFSHALLLILIVLIGIDLSTVRLARLTKQQIWVPCAMLLAIFMAAYIAQWLLPHSFTTLLTVASGFGWFSLSGSLVTNLLGKEMGSFALLTDLIREFYGIVLLFLCGRSLPRSVIGVCGATAMDSTLPFIKQNCRSSDVQMAIFSGFILTLLAPFLIVLFASL